MLNDRVTIMQQEKNQSDEQQESFQKDYERLKEKVEQENQVKISQQDAFKEEKEAQETKMKIQIDQIEELTK